MKQLLIWTIAVLSFGAVSCQKANVELEPDGPNVPEAGKQVEVMLNLSVAPTESAATKGADTQTFTSDALDVTYSNADEDGATTKSTTELTPDEDSRVSSAWILQFNKSDGKRNGEPVFLGSSSFGQQSGNEVGIAAKLTAATTAQVIYIIANGGSFSGANAPADEAALNKMVYSMEGEHRPPTSYGIPMLGRIEVSKVDATTTLLTGTLERLYAKVKLNLKNEFPDFTVGYVQLKNVAANFYYRPAQTGSVNFPAVAEGSHIDYLSEKFTKDTFVYYVPENLRTTTGTVNNAGERTLDKTDGKATYLEIGGYHITGTTVTQVTYRLPLGDVATSIADFNVRRNHVYTMDVTLKGANTVDQRITVVKMEPVTPAAGAVAPANCFMVTPGGTVKFDATIRGNGSVYDAFTGLERKIAPQSVALVWQDATGLISNANSSTGVVPLSGGMATVTAKSGTNGNALVAAYSGANGTGTILWSWHIWVTDYAPVGQGSVAANTAYSVTGGQVHTYGSRYLTTNPGKVIMDRNLGATQSGTITTGTTSAADAPKAFGQLYQWGRKDPLGQWNGSSTTSPAFAPWYNAGGTSITPAPIASAPITLQTAYQNPTVFYRNSYSRSDWLNPRNNNLWQDNVKNIFDPCPAGWKVPKGGANGTWSDFTSNGNTQHPGESYTGTIFPYFINGVQQTANGQFTDPGSRNVRNGRLYQQGSVKAWYPTGGRRGYTTGSLNDVGNYGFSWSSGVSGYCLFFKYDGIWLSSSTYRAEGQSVRCIQE